MSNFVELQILQEEEKVLMHIASKLNDQLNKLKVGIVESGGGGLQGLPHPGPNSFIFMQFSLKN